MGRYMVQRILATIPVLFIVAIITFSLIHLAPGDPAAILVGDEAQPGQVEALREALGLNDPLYVQGGRYIKDILTGNFGKSVYNQFPVTTLIRQRLEPTISVAIFSQVIAISIAIPLGILAAWKANTWIDRLTMIFAVIGFAIPSFWLGYNLVYIFAIKLGWFPAIGYEHFADGIGPWLKSITLPSISIGIITAALVTRMTRSSMLEVLREDYIRTARAKGLRELIVLLRHALKNAAIPVVTIIGLTLAALVGGLVVTEAVFAIPGVGRLIVDSILRRDYPVIQGVMLMVTVGFLAINLMVDMLYGFLDPKIRY
jgi:peptide/nickel transport system permease protein